MKAPKLERGHEKFARMITKRYGSEEAMLKSCVLKTCYGCGTPGSFLQYRGCDVCGREKHKRDLLNFYKDEAQKLLARHLSIMKFGPDEKQFDEQLCQELAEVIYYEFSEMSLDYKLVYKKKLGEKLDMIYRYSEHR